MNWTPENRMKLIKALTAKAFDGTAGEAQQQLMLMQRIMFLCDISGRWLERNEWIYKDAIHSGDKNDLDR